MLKRPDIFVAIGLAIAGCSGGPKAVNPDAGAAGAPVAGGSGTSGGGSGGSIAVGGTGGGSGGSIAVGGTGGGTAGGFAGGGIGGSSSGGGCGTIAWGGSSGGGELAGAGGTAPGGHAGGNAGAAGAPAVGCAGSFRTPTSPVMIDATLDCAAAGITLSVAAGTATRGFVAYHTDSPTGVQLATITAPDQVTVEAVPGFAGSYDTRIIADPTGAPMLVGHHLGDAGLQVAASRLGATGWLPETIVPSGGFGQRIEGAAFAGDGRAFALVNGLQDTVLHIRNPNGTWSDSILPRRSSFAALAIDSTQTPHVVTTSNLNELLDWRPGQAHDVLFTQGILYPLRLHAAAAGSGRVAVALAPWTTSIELFVPDGSGTVHKQTLAGTGTLNVVGCPYLPQSACVEHPARTCTETGDGVNASALAATTDGRLWLAYISQHVDRDMALSCTGGAAPYVPCKRELVRDRSTAEIVLVRVPTDGTLVQAGSIRWRTPVASIATGALALDARGVQLTLAFASEQVPARTAIRYIVVDTTNL